MIIKNPTSAAYRTLVISLVVIDCGHLELWQRGASIAAFVIAASILYPRGGKP